MTKLEITNETIDFIKSWEGFSATAYFDVSRWSVGYGTIGYEGEVVTEKEAFERLRNELEGYSVGLFDQLAFEPSTSQTTALLSAAYNLGVRGIKKVIQICNSGDFKAAAKHLRKYDHAGGNRLPALTRRREAEANLLEQHHEVHAMRGEPRVQFSRVYHLMDKNSSVDDFVSVAREAYEARSTVGFSYDDAGIGDLEHRTVVLHGQHTGAEEWFAEHYPGANVERELVHEYFNPKNPPVAPEPSVSQTKALVGIHGSADGSWGNPVLPETQEIIKTAKIEAYKGLSNESPATMGVLKDINPDMFVLIRLFAKVNEESQTAGEFVNKVGQDARAWYAAGVRHFEVHNEPNLTVEGMFQSWDSGAQFSTWWWSVVRSLQEDMPDAKWGYPGLSPGFTIESIRYDPIRFWDESWQAVDKCDFICAHCYWLDERMMYDKDGGEWYQRYIEYGKPIMITEFSNPSGSVGKQEKGMQYVKYYKALEGVHSAYSFLSTASSGFSHETWHGSNIATIVGQRDGATA